VNFDIYVHVLIYIITIYYLGYAGIPYGTPHLRFTCAGCLHTFVMYHHDIPW